MIKPSCTCRWADDIGDPGVGPDPYIVEPDEACPIHGREADPEAWVDYGPPDDGESEAGR